MKKLYWYIVGVLLILVSSAITGYVSYNKGYIKGNYIGYSDGYDIGYVNAMEDALELTESYFDFIDK